MKTVFLSASVPSPDRDKYVQSADVVAIRDSIKALVTVLVPKGRLVFGGHPAITPLVRLLVRQKRLAVRKHVIVYVSDFYVKDFSNELLEFEDRRVVPAVNGDPTQSLAAMRQEMLAAYDYDYGVFVGGMEGVELEYELFRKLHPRRPAFPVASTGAAAEILYKRHPGNAALQQQLTYSTLFKDILELR